MIEMVLVAVMGLSLTGMIWAEMHDPLSKKFWRDVKVRKSNGD